MIKDLRRDLGSPTLPVVIAELGAGERGPFQAAQAAVLDSPRVEPIRFVRTREFWEPEVEELVRADVWKGPDWVRFYNVGSERAYHYLGSAKMMYSMGQAFAESMIEMTR